MMMMTDYQHTEDCDLLITEQGDFAVIGSIDQHRKLLLLTQPGDWVLNPKAGCDLAHDLNNIDPTAMLMRVRDQFFRDGVVAEQIQFIDGKIQITG